jgi:hypothetical protein
VNPSATANWLSDFFEDGAESTSPKISAFYQILRRQILARLARSRISQPVTSPGRLLCL